MIAPTLVCPDCTGAGDFVIEHDDTCPTLRTLDQVCARDEQWFRNHPFAEHRWRDLDPAERADIAITGLRLHRDRCRVLVVNHGNGWHRRHITQGGSTFLIVHDVPPAQGWGR